MQKLPRALLATSTLLLLATSCGSDADKQLCSKQNNRFAAFQSFSTQNCSLTTSYSPGAQTATTCEASVRGKCNDADKASMESFLTCIEKLEVCDGIATGYETCFNQHGSKVRTDCFETFFGKPQ